MASNYIVKWTPVPKRKTMAFATLSEAVAYAVSVVSPRMGSVDILQPNGPTISVIATEVKR